MKKRIFVTGARGFIGKNICNYLRSKYNLSMPSSKQLDLLNTEKVADYLRKNSFDAVVHCAADVISRNYEKDPTLILYNNMMMFANLARCNKLYTKMLYFGSGAEFDMRHYIPHVKEEFFDTHVPEDYYGFSKYLMAQHIRSTDNIFDLRLFGCFGKYEDWEVRFISNTLCRLMHDLDITIHQNVRFAYLYVEDLAKIVEL